MALRACDSCECCQGGDARACISSESAIGIPLSHDASCIVGCEERCFRWMFCRKHKVSWIWKTSVGYMRSSS